MRYIYTPPQFHPSTRLPDSNATDFLGNSLRRGTPSDCCHTDSNASTTAGNNQMQPQAQQNTPITQVSFGEDDSSCDSQTRWGKMNRKKPQTQTHTAHSRVHIARRIDGAHAESHRCRRLLPLVSFTRPLFPGKSTSIIFCQSFQHPEALSGAPVAPFKNHSSTAFAATYLCYFCIVPQ